MPLEGFGILAVSFGVRNGVGIFMSGPLLLIIALSSNSTSSKEQMGSVNYFKLLDNTASICSLVGAVVRRKYMCLYVLGKSHF